MSKIPINVAPGSLAVSVKSPHGAHPGGADAPSHGIEFVECDTCRAKPGTPTLCLGCQHNRSAIRLLRELLDERR